MCVCLRLLPVGGFWMSDLVLWRRSLFMCGGNGQFNNAGSFIYVEYLKPRGIFCCKVGTVLFCLFNNPVSTSGCIPYSFLTIFIFIFPLCWLDDKLLTAIRTEGKEIACSVGLKRQLADPALLKQYRNSTQVTASPKREIINKVNKQLQAWKIPTRRHEISCPRKFILDVLYNTEI